MEDGFAIPVKADKPVIVRVKRKASQSPLDAFWLEINERPIKRPLLDFEKLSISGSSSRVEELKTKKVFVRHLETVISSEVTVDVLQSFVSNSSDALELKVKNEGRRSTFRMENKQEQWLIKARQQRQEGLSKNARFEQIWRSRRGKKEAVEDEAVREMCRLYDVVRVDVEEKENEVQEKEDTELEDHRTMARYLPLLREVLPTAAEEIEDDIHDYVSRQAFSEDYVYDYYAVKDDANITEADSVIQFPLVQVEDDDFYDGPDDSEYETDDSNGENNPLNDYPDEETSEDDDISSRSSDEKLEVESRSSDSQSEEFESGSHAVHSEHETGSYDWSDKADSIFEDDMCYDEYDDGDMYGAGCPSDEDYR